MKRLTITLACAPYDRIMPMVIGQVPLEGFDLIYLPLEVEEIFWRQIRYGEFDVSEMSLSTYVLSRSKGDDRFIAIPVFPSRMFRHSSIFVNIEKGISKPGDLKGKTVGVPEYQLTAIVWVRGILQDHYGISPQDVKWRAGGLETPGRKEKVEIELPSAIDYAPIPENKTLSDMLAQGEIDALISPREPSCFIKGNPKVKRLFENYRTEEENYFKQTGIFPIMHTIVMKCSLYERHPWLAQSLFKAFELSKRICVENLKKMNACYATLPWLHAEIENTIKIMGFDYWPYGIRENEHVLATFLRYSYEQGLAKRLMSVEELFAPETTETFAI